MRPSDGYLAPGKDRCRDFGYGYLLWLLPGSRRQFAMFGDFGQRICVDPASKLVHGADCGRERYTEIWQLWSDAVKTFGG